MSLSISDYLRNGPATSREIQAGTGLNQTVVSRQLRSLGDRIIKLPSGRSPRYVMTCNAFGGDDKLPIAMIDAHGNFMCVAWLRPLTYGGFFVQKDTGMPSVLLGEGQNGLYDDLPYFLSDLSPQGFLGRQIAVEMSKLSDDFPRDPRHWNANHIGRYLISNGSDLPGNFRFGHAFLFIRRKLVVTSEKDYPPLADDAINGIITGSSAGGEQPKFTAYSRESSAHVIVKFSPKRNNTVAQRWRDILITEYHATETLHLIEIPAPETKLIEREGRLFLESRRFDRMGEYGRMPMISLRIVDAEFTGLGSGTWPQVMMALHKKNLVNATHVFNTAVLWAFGRLINNTDMHLGNLSLGIEGNVFSLLPAYDMCSMGFAPTSNGEVRPYHFVPPEQIGLNEEIGSLAKKMARDFWDRVAQDPRISDNFRSFLEKGNPIDLMQ